MSMPMRLLPHRTSPADRPVRPRRTARLRLTALYGALFLLSGVGLLTITVGLASVSSTTRAKVGTDTGPAAPHAGQYGASLHQLLAGSAIALAIMAVASVVLGRVVAGRVLRPLRAMTAAARRISEDNLHERLAMPGPDDELKDLADTIDGLLERLEGAFNAQRRFVANASHELRTPLATMRASLDVAVAKPGPVPAQTIALAGRLRTELDQIDQLLENFLVLARAQHGALPGHTTVSLDQVVSAALAERAGAIAAMHLTVHLANRSADAWVQGSHTLLCRMVDNVLDNAIGHNDHGGWIHIAIEADGPIARLVVATGGQVLDQLQVQQLAEPFRRLGAERTGSDNGAGLGLSIVAAIAGAHGGTLDLHARAEGGLQVAMTLPLAPHTALTGVPA